MLTGAARHEPETYRKDLLRYFKALDSYWDGAVRIPGYEPCPTRGGGNYKYYDDNAWMVLALAEAYHLTGEPAMARRADDTLKFVISGWDDMLGGGIWWHQGHKEGTKITCSNAPAAVACLTLAKLRPERRKAMTAKAGEIVAWTRRVFQDGDGLYMDSIHADTRRMNRAKLTYNSALMLRAELMLHQAGGGPEHLREAERIGRAAASLCHHGTLVYRDPPKWSHLMVEADLELHRHTGEPEALARARANGDAYFKRWQTERQRMKPIDQASIARALWLLVDSDTPAGRAFWKRADAAPER